MASFIELSDFRQTVDYETLQDKIKEAIGIKAVAIGDEATPTLAEVDWAKSALESPGVELAKVINYVIAANSTATIAQIIAATDVAIQTNVNNAVDKILGL